MSTLTRWSPANQLFRHRFHRLFDDLFNDLPYRTSGDREEVAQGSWTPPVDIRETGDGVEIQVELPGLSKNDVEITLEDNVLTLSGERRFENVEQRDSYHRIERPYGRFSRSFSLPGHVQQEGVQARFKDGVLTVQLPKADEAKPRKISIG